MNLRTINLMILTRQHSEVISEKQIGSRRGGARIGC
jgi:hypothetical protein